MIKVYFGNRVLILAYSSEVEHLKMDFDAIHLYSSRNELKQFVTRFVEREDLKSGCIYYHNLAQLHSAFCQYFRVIYASGGLVRNAEGDYLIIERKGMIDLPKGKAEDGESAEQTALREVEEETGLSNLVLGKYVCSSFHTYPLDGQLVLKETKWYSMSVDGVPMPTPQALEDITQARWVGRQTLIELSQKSYPSVKEVVEKFMNAESID